MMARSSAPEGPDTLAQDQPLYAENLLRRTAGPYIWVMIHLLFPEGNHTSAQAETS